MVNVVIGIGPHPFRIPERQTARLSTRTKFMRGLASARIGVRTPKRAREPPCNGTRRHARRDRELPIRAENLPAFASPPVRTIHPQQAYDRSPV